MNWYYQCNDESRGPVSEETFRSLIANGSIRPDTLVWHDGMSEWLQLAVAAPTLVLGEDAMPPPRPGGFVSSSSIATNAELKKHARTGPADNYWTFVWAFIVWVLVELVGEIVGVIVPFFGSFVLGLVFYFLENYGFANLSLRGADHRKLKVGDAFIGFSQYGRATTCGLATTFYALLWSLLLIVPGIVKYYAYMLTPYLAIEHPDWSITEAITESRRLMDGNKWRAFMLDCSFAGWWLLVLLTFGLLAFWLIPYISITEGVFYRAVVREKGPRPTSKAT